MNPKNQIYFTRFPNHIYDTLLMSQLPLPAKLIVLIVIRGSIGMHQSSCLIEWSMLRDFLPIDKNRVTGFVNGLIQLNVLHGGEVKRYSDGRSSVWELSVNPDTTSWDISTPSKIRTTFYRFIDRNKQWRKATQPTLTEPNEPKCL